METNQIFISYSRKDAQFVADLLQAIVDQGISEPWVDFRNLKGGDFLEEKIFKAIDGAGVFLIVASPNTFTSTWVKKEAEYAGKTLKTRNDFRIIPLLLDDTPPASLQWIFGKEVIGVPVSAGPGGISASLPGILTALGLRLPNEIRPPMVVAAEPMEELELRLTDPCFEEKGGVTRARARARLVYWPSDFPKSREVQSGRFTFTAPLGPIEMEELEWYLERYFQWPVGVFRERAARVEKDIKKWGEELFTSAIPLSSGAKPLGAWKSASSNAERRFTVLVDEQIDEEADDETRRLAGRAAAQLLSLPWELLHDGRDCLFQGAKPVCVRRRLPNREAFDVPVYDAPVRVLLVTARPEDARAGYIDHRASALPLAQALETLGDLAELTVLSPATFPAMDNALRKAREEGKPFHVVHFDGHGVYDPNKGLGGLCFENPRDTARLEMRGSEIVLADRLASVIRDHRIPLVFLEACQSAQSDEKIKASVASALLDRGVVSVVAMSHSVLVVTARRFVTAFYKALVSGKRVGKAMLEGQNELKNDSFRMKIIGAGELHMQDWFVPVLFQEKDDPQLFTQIPSEQIRGVDQQARQIRLGKVPAIGEHGFVGRSRELLAAERLLEQKSWAVICGQGGEGKTTLAAELARWLVQTGRFRRAAFVSVEDNPHARAVLGEIGSQLIPGYSVGSYPESELFGNAFQPVQRALEDAPTLIVIDNMETILPPPTPGVAWGVENETDCEARGGPAGLREALYEPEILEALFMLCDRLLKTGNTRLVFTSREHLPPPFDKAGHTRQLSRMAREDAVELVSRVMARQGLELKEDDAGNKPEAEALVDSVNCHARSLVLIAPHIHKLGIEKTTETLGRIMADIHQKFPESREKSLFASVELSLRRLSPDARKNARVLGVFHGGAHLGILAFVLAMDEKQAESLARELETTGLAEMMSYGHLRLHPALCPYLARELDADALGETRKKWAGGMKQLAESLVRQQFQDARISAALTVLELPNLLALLDYLRMGGDPEETLAVAMKLESLLEYLGRSHILKRVAAVREGESKKLGGWSHTRFATARHGIERLLQNGDLNQAFKAARALSDKSSRAGEHAYSGADYDIAMANFLLGRVMQMGGASEQAVAPIAEARNRFQALADQGDTSAAGMASACLTEMGDCLRNLGRLDEAAAAYEEGIKSAEKLNDARGAATGKFQLGTVRLYQKQYKDAIEAYEVARDAFEQMGEPGSVASAWHQIGMVHEETGNFDLAEGAYKKSLAIKVQQNNTAGEARTLGQLGLLYDKFGRLEESVIFLRQAADRYVEIGDMAGEGRQRSNIAIGLIKLERHADARREIMRAIECKEPYGHAAELWKTYDILHDLEQAMGDREAAAEARRKAMELYLAYRRAGGENHSGGGRLCLKFAQAMRTGQTHEIKQTLHQLAENPHPYAKPLAFALQAILSGDRDPSLADNPELDFDDAAEVTLLLESLGDNGA